LAADPLTEIRLLAAEQQPAGLDRRLAGRAWGATWPTPSVRRFDAGLLLPQPEGQPADYTFTHEQVRQFSMAELTQGRRRQVHAAIVDLLLQSGDPVPAGLPLLAQHALAAGDTERAAHFSIDAATAALQSNAPEEALRLVEQALPGVSTSR